MLVLAIAVAFVAGSLVTSSIDFGDDDLTKLQKKCAKEPKRPQNIKPVCELLAMINAIPAGPPGEQGEKGEQGSAGAADIKHVTLNDDATGNAAGWNPPVVDSEFEITDTDITTASRLLTTVCDSGGECHVGSNENSCESFVVLENTILISCANANLEEGSILQYTIFNP